MPNCELLPGPRPGLSLEPGPNISANQDAPPSPLTPLKETKTNSSLNSSDAVPGSSISANAGLEVEEWEEEPLDAGALAQSEDENFEDGGPRGRKRARCNAEEEDDSDKPSQLVPGDIDNFLKLCEALQLLLASEITTEEIDQADGLIREYGLGLIEVRT